MFFPLDAVLRELEVPTEAVISAFLTAFFVAVVVFSDCIKRYPFRDFAYNFKCIVYLIVVSEFSVRFVSLFFKSF